MDRLGAAAPRRRDDRVDRRDSSRAPAAGRSDAPRRPSRHAARRHRPRNRPRRCAMPMRRAVRMIRQAISPRLAIRILANIDACAIRYIRNTPKLASARCGAFERSARRSAEAPARSARLGRVDDAVVPQPRAGVIGMALGLVLRADRRLERRLLLRAPVLRRAPPCRRAAPSPARAAACSPPITEMRALGHIHRKRGP